jgi:hypothetical protein
MEIYRVLEEVGFDGEEQGIGTEREEVGRKMKRKVK